MNVKSVDFWAGLSYVASGGLASTFVAVGSFLPHYQAAILGISAIAVGLAGLLLRLHKNPTPTIPTNP